MSLVQLLSGLWSSLGWSITWQLAVLALLAWVCQRLLRVRHPGAVHGLWWFVLLAPLVLAPLRLTLARHETAVVLPLPAPAARIVTEAQAARSTAPATPAPAEPAPAVRPAPSPPPAQSEIPVPSPSVWERLGRPGLAALVWLIGCAAVGLRLLLGHRWVRAMLRESAPVRDEALLTMLRELREAGGVAVSVALHSSAAVGAPVLYGWRRPVIVLPEAWLRALSRDDLRALLAHEVAHVARRDFASNIVQRVLAVPLFFHPGVWLANRHIALAREQMCDAWAAEQGADAASYAQSLMAAAAHARARFALVSVGVAEDRSTLFRRVEAIMGADGARRLSRKLVLVMAALLVLSAAAFAAVQLGTEALPPDLEQAVAALQSPDLEARWEGASAFLNGSEDPSLAVPALLRVIAANPDFVPGWPGTEDSTPTLALQALGEMRDPAFPPLLATLKDPDPAIRRAAALGLWSAVRAAGTAPSHSEIAAPLLALLEEEADPQVRVAAVVALAATGDPRAGHEFLRPMVTDADPRVRSVAAEGWGSLLGRGTEAAQTLFALLTGDEDERVRARAAWNLSHYADAPALDSLVEGMRSSDATVRALSAEAIADLGTAGVPETVGRELLKLLKDPVPEVRAAALRGMKAWSHQGGLPDTEPVIAALRDRSPQVRAAAAAAFEGANDPRAVSPLITATRDPDAGVREQAVKALGWLRNPRARDAFVAALKDGSVEVRRAAAAGLSQLKLPDTAPALITALGDPDPEVRRTAAWALSQVPSPEAAEPLRAALQDRDYHVRGTVAEAIGNRRDPGAAVALRPLLSDPEARVRGAAAMALGKLGDERSVVPIIALLDDPGRGVAMAAAAALGWLKDPRAVPALLRLMEAAKGREVQEVGRALGDIGDPSALDGLVAMARSSVPERRWSAVEAIGRINGPIAVAKVAPLLHSEEAKLRQAGVRALQQGKDPGIVEAVLPLLKDPNGQVRADAIETLARTNDPRVARPLLEALSDPHEFVRERAQAALGDMYHPAAAADVFIAALDNPDRRVRSQAANVLSRMQDPEVRRKLVEPMISALERGDNDQMTLNLAVDVLAGSHDPRAAKALITVARRRSGEASSYALNALGLAGGPEAEQFLIASLKDRDAGVRRTAAEGLAQMRSRAAVPYLMPLLKEKDATTRFVAAQALAAAGDRRAVPYLLPVLRDKEEWKAATAAHALAEIGDRRAVAPLWTAAQRPERYVRAEALAALAKFHDPRTFGPLLDELETINGNPGTAAEGLGDLGDKRAVEPLLRVLREQGSNDNVPAIAAAHALGKLGDKRAVPELISSMQRYQQNPGVTRGEGPSHMLEADVNALRALTGQNFGTNVGKWREWWEKQKGGA